MSELGVLVCDDQPGMRLILRRLIERAQGFRLVGEAESGEACLELFEALRPQVVFMDIEMPGMSGVDCARRLQEIDPKAALVFATAHEGYMGDAFELYAFDYLLKPFKAERVLATLERIRSLLAPRMERPETPAAPAAQAAPAAAAADTTGRGERLFLHTKDGAILLNADDVILIQREDRYSVLYTAAGSFTTGDTLAELESRLDPKRFFRCHRSYIINLTQVDSITPYGRWTFVVRFKGIREDALMTHEKYEQLEALFG